MKMFWFKRYWAIAVCSCLFTLSLLAFPVQSSTSNSAESFVEWCAQSEQFEASTQQTIQSLLEVAGTQDCQSARDHLQEMTQLDLSDRDIADLAPVSSLPHLTALYLSGNQIVDLSPIAQLSNLNTLIIHNNLVQDLTPLSEVRSLTVLHADRNRIQSIAPLSKLSLLNDLVLENNQIFDLAPLANLRQLTSLTLGGNRIRDVSALATLTQLVNLDLGGNRISQLEALADLVNLTRLDIRNNPLRRKICPISPPRICKFSDGAAEVYQAGEEQLDQGQVSAALASFQSALAIYQAEGDRRRESNALDRIGNVYDTLGEYANALDFYQQADVIRKEIGDRQGASETLINLGITYIRLGQSEKALDFLTEAIAVEQALAPRTRNWQQSALNERAAFSALALAYSEQGEDAQALQFAKLSLAGYRRSGDRSGEAIALVRVGTAYLNLGNLDKAQIYLDKALDLSQAIEDPLSIARSLKALGDFSASDGNTAVALALYDDALNIRTELGDTAGAGETLNAQGTLLLESGQTEAATTALLETVDFWEALRPGLTDENKISIADSQARTYELLQRSLLELGEIEAALEISERGRARAFVELLAHRLSLRGRSVSASRIPPPNIQQIRQIARNQAATLVEYAQVEDDLYIWVMSPDGDLNFVRQPLLDKPVTAWVEEFREALNIPGRGLGVVASEDAPRELEPAQNTLNQLYELLIKPIDDFLPTDPDATVIIVPQGELFLVPFSALVNAENEPLIEQHPILFAPAISLLSIRPTIQTSLRIGEDPALVVGNPAMPNEPGTEIPLSPLIYAELEALEVAEILNTQALTQGDATKDVVAAGMETAKIVHLATHGLLDDLDTGVPGILAFAPTQDDKGSVTDEGYLTAAEILEMPLVAQLAVLSACDTARGNITGDGVIGLSRSLLTAGVDTVIVTLWSIPDESTSVLMGAFYRQLEEEPNRAIALRNAMLTTRQTPGYEHPVQWAAFSLYGQTGV